MQGLVKDGGAAHTPVPCQFPEPTPVLKLLASLHHSDPCGPGLTSRGQTQPAAAPPFPRQATVPVPSESWAEELHSLNCPFSFSGYSFPPPQTQSPQVIGNQSFRKPFSLRSPNHPTPKSWLRHSLGLCMVQMKGQNPNSEAGKAVEGTPAS